MNNTRKLSETHILTSAEVELVGRPCLTSRNNCSSDAYRATQAGLLICTRCRTKASIRLCPDLAFRLLESGLSFKNCSRSQPLALQTYSKESSSQGAAQKRARIVTVDPVLKGPLRQLCRIALTRNPPLTRCS